MHSTSALFALIFAARSVTAYIPASASTYDTHLVREIRSGVKAVAYHPPSVYKTFGAGVDHPLSKRSDASLEDRALAFIQSYHSSQKSSANATNTDISAHIHRAHTAQTVHVAYAHQTHEDVPFANAVANVAFDADGEKVVAFGSSFVTPKTFAPSKPTVQKMAAIKKAESELGGTHNGYPTSVEYVLSSEGHAALTHVIQVQNDHQGTWYEAFVDAHSGELVSFTDFVAHATFRVIPLSKQYPTDGFSDVVDPEDPSASPFGWLSTSSDESHQATVAAGNNAQVYVNDTPPAQTSPQTFLYSHNPAQEPNATGNWQSAAVNAFYVVNSLHDIFYRYGFTEAAGNFQEVNAAGKGGIGNDSIRISVQDWSGTNNANFATPPDGKYGLMRMFEWTKTDPKRDGALDNDIVTHETTHGVTNRMTGGGTARCLQTAEASGLGEGWSDAVAAWTERRSSAVEDYRMGQYVLNDDAGVRTYPYSTDPKVNPLKYASVVGQQDVHNIGEIWANTLINVYAQLVGKYGWDADAATNPGSTAGNAVWFHLFMDALLLQPCNPTFLSARDAWFQADVNRYNGTNRCLMWNTFASKGLGMMAANFTNDATLPSDCQ